MTISGSAGFLATSLSSLPNPIVVGKFLEAAQADEYVRITNIANGSLADTVVITADGNISQQSGIYEQYSDSNPATWTNDVEYRINEDGELVFDRAPDNLSLIHI